MTPVRWVLKGLLGLRDRKDLLVPRALKARQVRRVTWDRKVLRAR